MRSADLMNDDRIKSFKVRSRAHTMGFQVRSAVCWLLGVGRKEREGEGGADDSCDADFFAYC